MRASVYGIPQQHTRSPQGFNRPRPAKDQLAALGRRNLNNIIVHLLSARITEVSRRQPVSLIRVDNSCPPGTAWRHASGFASLRS